MVDLDPLRSGPLPCRRAPTSAKKKKKKKHVRTIQPSLSPALWHVGFIAAWGLLVVAINVYGDSQLREIGSPVATCESRLHAWSHLHAWSYL